MTRHAYIPSARHQQPARQVDRPRPGFFRMRLVKGGPNVAAAILHGPTPDPDSGEALDRSWWWQAVIDGKPAGEPGIEPGANVFWIWTSGDPISADDYELMVEQAEWDRTYAPTAPAARPREAVDLRSMPSPF